MLAGNRGYGLGQAILDTMKLVIVRHGETVENVNQIIQGNLDGTLSENGIQQAKGVALQLKSEKFDQVWSSDLGRAVDTAKYIMKFHPKLKLHLTPDIREMSFGVMQGKYSRAANWDSLDGPVLERKFPEGESALEMSHRAINFVNELFIQFPKQKTMLITHGGPIRAIRSTVEGIPLEQMFSEEIPNVSVWKYDIERPLTLDPIP